MISYTGTLSNSAHAAKKKIGERALVETLNPPEIKKLETTAAYNTSLLRSRNKSDTWLLGEAGRRRGKEEATKINYELQLIRS